jgi:polygalacturonase
VRGVTIASDPRLPNNDGIDISGSQDVRISDCRIDVGDDGIVLNGRGRETRRVAVSNCLISSECAALKVGWEYTRHSIGQIVFSNCVLRGCNRGLAAYSCNGADIEDVLCSNIVMDSNAPLMFARPIHLDLRRGRDTGTFGAMRRIQVSNWVGRTAGRILCTAEDGGSIDQVTLRDVHLSYPYLEDPEPIAEGNRSAQFSNPCRAARRARAAVVADNCHDFTVEGLRLTWPEDTVPADWKHEACRENGPTRIFHPDYAPRPCAFSAAWLRKVSGVWRSPQAEASETTVPRFDRDQASTLRVDPNG